MKTTLLALWISLTTLSSLAQSLPLFGRGVSAAEAFGKVSQLLPVESEPFGSVKKTFLGEDCAVQVQNTSNEYLQVHVRRRSGETLGFYIARAERNFKKSILNVIHKSKTEEAVVTTLENTHRGFEQTRMGLSLSTLNGEDSKIVTIYHPASGKYVSCHKVNL